MKAELNLDFRELVEGIAKEVIKAITPRLNPQTGADSDRIFTVSTLAEYLKVDPTWVYKQVSLKALPYFKSGKYTRFRKKDIDKWINLQMVNPIPQIKSMKIRG